MPVPPAFVLLEIAIEPKSKEDQEKLGVGLTRLISEDPSFVVRVDAESGQTILAGSSEQLLDAKIAVLKHVHGVDLNVGAPQVAYRETLGRRAEVEYTHKRIVAGGIGEFARVKLVFEPGEPNSGAVAESRAEAAPLTFVVGALRGVEAAAQDGLIAGFPVIDFEAILTDVVYHDLDSSALTFEIAARGAFKKLREEGAPILLEPVMRVEVLTPDEYMGDVIGDLNSRRGQVQGAETRGKAQMVTAFVPLASMFGYFNTLRSFSQGRADFSMAYSHYAPIPRFAEPDPDFSPAIGMRLRT